MMDISVDDKTASIKVLSKPGMCNHCTTVHSISVAIQYTLLLVSNTMIVDIKNSHPECYYVGVVHSLHNATS